jgi:hypothetical protein
MTPTFHNVILAGVHDIKHLKRKMRDDSEHQYNSPWNIAATFKVNMSFSSEEISTMLLDYEKDHKTGMNIKEISEKIFDYTNGYPYLVCYICKKIDEKNLTWNEEGIDKAVKILLNDNNSTLLEDVIKNIEQNKDFAILVKKILISGAKISFEISNPAINLGFMYCILKEKEGKVVVSNIIFETKIYNYLISISEINILKNQEDNDEEIYFKDNKLDMQTLMSRFSSFIISEYREQYDKFLEINLRFLFLSFLKGIINGKGQYVVEPETRRNKRMDILVFYEKQEFIVELKVWQGKEYQKRGRDQLIDYLKSRNQKIGYLITFVDNIKISNYEFVTNKINKINIQEFIIYEIIIDYKSEA